MKQVRSVIFSWLMIVAGIFLAACAYRMYLIPNQIAPGGFTGIAQLINHGTGWSVGMLALALNVPLFALSLRSMGLKFGLKSLIASVGFSLAVDYFLFLQPVTDDRMLASVFGGVLSGVGFGLILRGGASTGGTDMLGALLHKRFRAIKVSVFTFAVDALVIALSALVFDITSGMFAMISAFLFSKLLDMVLEGPNSAKAYYIISSKNMEIADLILKELGRGVTALNGVGMYSRDEKVVLLCVINRMETVKLRGIVARVDEKAFVIATNVSEALGEGFAPHI
ncbi:YitT family protein [Eubacteriales bacterium OttesenSCG-928-N13]|nr:YitT family protein [Eubacteriales bacterium OttesenSCG-928-N13]